MKVIVCGGRGFDPMIVQSWLSLSATTALGAPITCVVHGGAWGADFGAAKWARQHNVAAVAYPITPADWKRLGRKAGPLRNQRMLDEQKPDAVVAFPGGRGTGDMMRRAEKAGVAVIVAMRS